MLNRSQSHDLHENFLAFTTYLMCVKHMDGNWFERHTLEDSWKRFEQDFHESYIGYFPTSGAYFDYLRSLSDYNRDLTDEQLVEEYGDDWIFYRGYCFVI